MSLPLDALADAPADSAPAPTEPEAPRTFLVGDVQGCHDALQRLAGALGFEPARGDRLWLLGDLVNRGPDSLGVLRWASQTEGVDAVLGNHDLHLLARARGVARPGRGDTLDAVLDAPDREALLGWLCARPLAVRLVAPRDVLLVHAGLAPWWDADAALAAAATLEAALRGPSAEGFLAELARRGESPEPAHAAAIAAAATLTRARVLDASGASVRYTGPLDARPPGTHAWFAHPERVRERPWVAFGHWAALGPYVDEGQRVWGLDSGCVWGRALTGLCLDDGTLTQVPARR